MAKILVVPPEKTCSAAIPIGCSGSAEVSQYVDGARFPLHLNRVRLSSGEALTVGPVKTEFVGYVWHGEVMAGGHRLSAGSSFIVETGEGFEVTGTDEGGDILLFSSSSSHGDAVPGGHVHILPNGNVPRFEPGADHGVSGGMHADSDCETCDVWLHENGFPGAQPTSPEDLSIGVHSHSEDEIIFIISGQIRLGRKLFPEGTANAIPADTLYSFTAGPDGMRFINFRAAKPSEIKFANGNVMDETGYWRDNLGRPEYLTPA